jgi:hypothetical protein
MKYFYIPLYYPENLFLFDENSAEYKQAEAAEQQQTKEIETLFDYISATGAAAEIHTAPDRFIILSRNIRGKGVTITRFFKDNSEVIPLGHQDTETAREFLRESADFVPSGKGQIIIKAMTA